MDENEMKRILEELNKIKEKKEAELIRAQRQPAKDDYERNEKNKEITARTSEVNEINSEIEKLQLLYKGKAIIQEKRDKLKKAQDELSKYDKRKDPQVYRDGEEEVAARKKELEDEINKYKNSNNANKSIDEQLNDFIKSIEKKYHISIKEKLSKDSDKEKIKVDEQKSDDRKSKDETLQNKINEKMREIKECEKSMANIGTPGFDGKELLEKYKKLIKELEELKSVDKKAYSKTTEKDTKKQKGNYYMPTEEEIKKYFELRKKGYADDSPEIKEFLQQCYDKRYKTTKEKDEKSEVQTETTAIQPTSQKNEIVPTGTTEIQPVPQKNSVDKGKSEPLSIVYSGKDNQYIVSNFEEIVTSADFENENEKLQYIKEMTEHLSKPIEAINFKNKKEKIDYLKKQYDEDTLKYIFGDNYKKAMKKLSKTYDPQLVEILADLDINFAKSYISELAKGKDDKKEPLPYIMKYNLKDMRKNRKNNKMSLGQRARVNKMAKRNYKKDVAEYVPDDKSRRWLAIPIVGVLAAGGLAIANQDKTEEKSTPIPSPEITGTTTEKETTTQTQTTEPSKDDIESSVDDALNNETNSNEDLILGSRANIPDGVTYTQDSLGNGKSGEIGTVSWRPAGDYTIDRVAIYYNGKLLENLGTEGTNVDEIVKTYAQKLGVNPSEIVQKVHICVGDKHNGATGWLNMDELTIQDLKNNISKTYEQVQQEQANRTQQNAQTNEEQSHEDR